VTDPADRTAQLQDWNQRVGTRDLERSFSLLPCTKGARNAEGLIESRAQRYCRISDYTTKKRHTDGQNHSRTVSGAPEGRVAASVSAVQYLTRQIVVLVKNSRVHPVVLFCRQAYVLFAKTLGDCRINSLQQYFQSLIWYNGLPCSACFFSRSEHARYHYEDRTHLGLGKGTPNGRIRSIGSRQIESHAAFHRG